MCSKPSMPAVSTATQKQEEVVAPKQADSSVTKADAAQQTAVLGARNKQTTLAGRDVKTAPRGLTDGAVSQKKQLLGA